MKPEMFTTIVMHLRPRLLAVASQFDADADAAEDAVQEALMRLWTAWNGLAEATDAERLAVRLTKHACVEAYRRRGRRQAAERRVAAVATETVDTVHEAELREALERAVAALPPSERRLWTMFAEAQMNSAQIAAATGINVRSVSTMLSSARKRIMESLKKGGAI